MIQMLRSHLRPLATKTPGEGEILGLTKKDGDEQRGISAAGMDEGTYMVTRLAWIAAKLVSSKRETR